MGLENIVTKFAEKVYDFRPPTAKYKPTWLMKKYLQNLAVKYTAHGAALSRKSTHGLNHWKEVADRAVYIAKKERRRGQDVNVLDAYVAGIFHDFGRTKDYANEQGHEMNGAKIYKESVHPHLEKWGIGHDKIIHSLANGDKQDPSGGKPEHYLACVVEDADRYTVDQTTGVKIHHDYINTPTGMALVKRKQFWQKLRKIKLPTWEEVMEKQQKAQAQYQQRAQQAQYAQAHA